MYGQLRLRWYPGRYAPNLMSIIQDCDDIISCIPKAERDAVILEEPEHLNWSVHIGMGAMGGHG